MRAETGWLFFLSAVISLASSAIPPTSPHGCEFGALPDASPKVDVRKIELEINVQFPQFHSAILGKLSSTYLLNEIDAAEMMNEPTPEDVDRMANVMNAVHKHLNVPRRTEGHPEGDPKRPVKREMIANLSVYFGAMSLRNIAKAAKILGCQDAIYFPSDGELYPNRAGSEGFRRKLASDVDSIFHSPHSQVAQNLILVGRAFDATLQSPEIKKKAQDFKKFLSNPENQRFQDPQRFDKGALQMIKDLRAEFLKNLKSYLPSLTDEQREKISLIFCSV